MFCPECKVEYRPGFTRCSDCDVDLVERLPGPDRGADAEVSRSQSRMAYSTDEQKDCVIVCEGLRAAGIPFLVFQQSHQFLKGVERKFKIHVPRDCYSRAEEVIRNGQVDFTDEPEDQKIMELAASDDGISIPVPADRDWDPAHWNWEDATVEVWRESDHERARMIELSLGENRIHARTEVLRDGSRRILVLPRDESRGREIVREIGEGTPLV
jgi:hypothetical protein